MPAVGMRRSTRIFGARVLRSGKQLWTDKPTGVLKEQNHRRSPANSEGDLIENFDNKSEDDSELLRNGGHDETHVLYIETNEMGTAKNTVEHSNENGNRWGAVYQRKRKRMDPKNDVGSASNSDRRYGKQFVRKQGLKRLKQSQATLQLQITCVGSSGFLIFSVFLSSILKYMSRVSLTLQQLSEFLLSEPLSHVYSVHGIRFLQNSTSNTSSGFCRIMGSRCFIPMFTLNFSAVPSAFMYLYRSLLLRSATVPNAHGMEVESDSMTSNQKLPLGSTCELDNSGIETGVQGTSSSGKRRAVTWCAATPKSAARTLQLRNVNSRSIQKRRSSVRLRRGRNLSTFVVRKASGHLTSGLYGIPFSPVKSTQQFISPVRGSPKRTMNVVKATLVGSADDIDASSCSANLLVIESDKCFREQGATIKLESSASDQWFVRIKGNGTREYNLLAEKVMRPCSSNRITRATIWTSDNGWKLEFCDRRDWLIFKKLYKECSDRNVQALTTSAIPVPNVVGVSCYGDSNSVPFRRPDSYITWKDDELTRALEKGSSIYDMDSDDEAWLNKFNDEHISENQFDKQISADVFELIISSFEKGLFCGQDDYLDVNAAVDLCISLERKEVLEVLHGYWMKKRKQKHSALVKVFQFYQPRRTQLLPNLNTILRKKRSFKRQASKPGRGKPRTFLQAMAVEHDTFDEQKNILKLQEADAAVYRSDSVAVCKRKRAQLLMEVADLSAYKATMALRISEAVALSKSLTDVTDFLLG